MERLTAVQVKDLTSSIFVRFWFKGGFRLLTDSQGKLFHIDELNMAKDFVRNNFSEKQVELSNFEQALMNNGIWDNL